MLLSDLTLELNQFLTTSKETIFPWLEVMGVFWLFNFFNWMIGSRLNILGIVPRRLWGLPGILFSPFLHQDFNHLLFNSIPLFVLGLVILNRGWEVFILVTVCIMLLGGFTVWLFGRRALHLGASGLVSGYFGYLLIMAYLQPSLVTVLTAILIMYYFGGIFLGIFPQEDKISWESHLFGFLGGLATGMLFQFYLR